MAKDFKTETRFKQHSKIVVRPDVTLHNHAVCVCVACSLKFEFEIQEGKEEFDIDCPRCGEAKGVVLRYDSRVAPL